MLTIDKAHELANAIAECEEAGIFDMMDKRTREDIENAHATANFQERLRVEEESERQCQYCPSRNAYPLRLRSSKTVMACEGCYERGVENLVMIHDSEAS